MPNGHNIKPEEFEKMEAPLRQIDAHLSEYASRHKMQIRKNYHNVPERSLVWTEENEKFIQIHLTDPDNQTFNIWICAIKDINGERYWKQEYFIKNEPLAVIQSNLINDLDRAAEILHSWKDQDLVPSGVRVQKMQS